MTDMTPTKFDFDTVTGASTTKEPLFRPLSSLKGYFHDEAAYAAARAEGDPLVYEYFDMGVPETSATSPMAPPRSSRARSATNTS
jgi:glucose-6-phosphate isomerase